MPGLSIPGRVAHRWIIACLQPHFVPTMFLIEQAGCVELHNQGRLHVPQVYHKLHPNSLLTNSIFFFKFVCMKEIYEFLESTEPEVQFEIGRKTERGEECGASWKCDPCRLHAHIEGPKEENQKYFLLRGECEDDEMTMLTNHKGKQITDSEADK